MKSPSITHPPAWTFLHGFTQSHQSWWPVIEALVASGAVDRTAGALRLADLPGHGLSEAPDGPLESTADELLRSLGHEPTVLVGYSMGARLALATAVGDARRPSTASSAIAGLILIGGTAGIEDRDARSARVEADAERAARLERDGVATFVTDWTRLDLFGGFHPTDLEYRRRNRADGLAASLRRHGTGSQRSVWDDLATVTAPTLVVAGALDHKFVELGQRLNGLLPNATFATIPGAAHAAHLQQPDEFASVATRWLTTSVA